MSIKIYHPSSKSTIPIPLTILKPPRICEYESLTKVGFVYNRGSAHETEQEEGLAHLSEHLMFRDFDEQEHSALMKECDIEGIMLDAYTSRENSLYWATSRRQQVPRALNLLNKVTKPRETTEDALKKELGVVVQEMNSVYADPHELLYELFHSTCLEGSMKHPVIGSDGSVHKLTPEDVKSWRERHMSVIDGIVVVSLEPEDVIDKIKSHTVVDKCKMREKIKVFTKYNPECMKYTLLDRNEQNNMCDGITYHLVSIPFLGKDVPIETAMKLNAYFSNINEITTHITNDLKINDIKSRVIQYNSMTFLLLTFCSNEDSFSLLKKEFPDLIKNILVSESKYNRWKVLMNASMEGDLALPLLAQVAFMNEKQANMLISKENYKNAFFHNIDQEYKYIMDALHRSSVISLDCKETKSSDNKELQPHQLFPNVSVGVKTDNKFL